MACHLMMMRRTMGVSRILHWGQNRRAEGRDREVGFLGRGSNPLPTSYGYGERCELPQWGSGRSPDRPKVSTIFSTQNGLF